jgi:uncharacterized protein
MQAPVLAPGARTRYRIAMPVIDFHTHAFPDAIAVKTVKGLAAASRLTTALDGRLSSLLASMDAAGIERSVALSIATRPGQFDSIRAWSRGIASDRIIPFPSVHPRDARAVERVGILADDGFKGLKLHSYYQDFDLDDPSLDPFYGAMEERGLICLVHSGFDSAFPSARRADPARAIALAGRFPRLKLVASHLGGWKDWDEAALRLPGGRLWIDTSFSLEWMSAEAARGLILRLPADRLLFGTDSPWADQAAAVGLLRALRLDATLERAILHGNARALLDG